MNAKELQPSRKSTLSRLGRPPWWAGTVLALAAVLVISVAMYGTLAQPAGAALYRAQMMPKTAHLSPDSAQLVSDAAAQGIYGYLIAHGAGQFTADQLGPNIARRVARDQRRAFETALDAPNAAAQGVTNYLRAHGANVK